MMWEIPRYQMCSFHITQHQGGDEGQNPEIHQKRFARGNLTRRRLPDPTFPQSTQVHRHCPGNSTIYSHSQFNSKSLHATAKSFTMACKPLINYARPHTLIFTHVKPIPAFSQPSYCRARLFSSSMRLCQRRTTYKDSFGTRLRKALGETKIKWYPIPAVLGIGFLGLAQLYRVNEREKSKLALEGADDGTVNFKGTGADELDSRGRPKRRERIRPTGPWLVCSNAIMAVRI